MGAILDGKVVSTALKEGIKSKCEILLNKYSLKPALAIIMVGDNPASQVYVSSKERACEYVGIRSIVVKMDAGAKQEEVISEINKLCADKSVHGVMVQLPLPVGLDEKQILSHITAEKDVDGLTSDSMGKLLLGDEGFVCCTPKGIIEILKHYNIDFVGKHAVVIGRSNMVGKPVALKLLQENCTVTVCHSKTVDIKNITLQADILVVAVGKKHFVTADMVKPGAVVVDVGINRVDGKLYGDVHFDSVIEKASYVTPVPGGVGLMTVTMLIDNTVEACLKQNGLKNEF